MGELNVLFVLGFFLVFCAGVFFLARAVARGIFSLAQLPRRWRLRNMAGIRQTWAKVAERLAGELGTEQSSEGEDLLVLGLVLDGVEVTARQARVIHEFGEETAWEEEPYTELSAEASVPPSLELVIRDWVRTEGLPPAFDTNPDLDIFTRELLGESFTVGTSHRDLALALVTADVARELRDLGDYAFLLRDRLAFAGRIGFEDDGDRLERAMRLTAGLARGKERLVDRFRTLARELGGAVPPREDPHPLFDEPILRVQRREARALVTIVPAAEGLSTVIEAELMSLDTEPFALALGAPPAALAGVPPVRSRSHLPELFGLGYRIVSADEDQTVERLAEHQDQLVRSGVRSLEVDRLRARLVLPGVVMDRETLGWGLDLILELASPQVIGPYR